MSADNGVYVLETNSRANDESEFRIAHLFAFENLFTRPYDQPNHAMLIRAFGRSPVYRSRAEAVGEAKDLLARTKRSGFECEYGILQFSLDMAFPASAIKVADVPDDARRADASIA